jgi:hypothetical protein
LQSAENGCAGLSVENFPRRPPTCLSEWRRLKIALNCDHHEAAGAMNTKAGCICPTRGGTAMANANMPMDVLCAEDIDTLRLVFDQFCEVHQRARSDDDMEICANIMMRLYQSGERDSAVLTRACEAALRKDTAISA